MEKKLTKKMTRYIELSEKFSKTDIEIFPNEERDNLLFSNGTSSMCIGSGSITVGALTNHIYLNGTVMIDGKEVYVDERGNVKAKDPSKPLTRGEEYKAREMSKADAKATLIDEYDEYLELRKSLKGYFKGLDNLLND